MKNLSRLLLLVIPVVLVFAAPSPRSRANEHEYIGSQRCKKCHIKEHRSWAETPMAKAFDILQPGERAEIKTAAGMDPNKDYRTDPECLPCHVVGYGKPGGFVDIETTPDHVGIGCESCHGPGGTYQQDQYMSLKNKNYKRTEILALGLIAVPTEETCTSECHNDDNPTKGKGDYVFDFATQNQEPSIHKVFPLKYQHE
jgi:hypothetical protein